MASRTWDAVLAWRARRQHLAERVPASKALEVVSEIAGLHAQVMSCAELTLWARVEDLDPAFVKAALWEERTLVKTWAMPARCTCCARTSSRATSARSRGCVRAITSRPGCATTASPARRPMRSPPAPAGRDG